MKITKTVTSGIFAITLATACVLPMTAAAKIKSSQESVNVSIADLDLSSEKGVQMLESRIKRAAKSVCGSTDARTAGSLANARANKQCVTTSVTSAMESVEHRFATANLSASLANPILVSAR